MFCLDYRNTSLEIFLRKNTGNNSQYTLLEIFLRKNTENNSQYTFLGIFLRNNTGNNSQYDLVDKLRTTMSTIQM